ncbi:DGQHR domain-containing protein [uncultured Chryseobacterium sp.]|uniref:DGQHR domain-containing protein n=1 Tax=uncultured Chryseobacterium sp. TaxID=259322 RepID=UPI0025832EE3|nr:DGQHR domain-containing protein [uncultured Chryseobacterium sp.]
MPNLTNLTSSWTKYDSVKVIQILKENEIAEYINSAKTIDKPTLSHFLGIKNVSEEVPSFWNEIQQFPEEIGLFGLVAAIFTHHENIKSFAERYSTGNMEGIFITEEDKRSTNLRSALVESGAAEKIFRRKKEVPYDLSKLYRRGNVGLLAKELFINRLKTIGYSEAEIEENFLNISVENFFPKALGLTDEQFNKWTSGHGISNSLYELEKNGITYEKFGRIKAFKVKQWLNRWDSVPNYGAKNRRKPQQYFYQFNLPALLLKRIYDVHSRNSSVDKNDEVFSQRKHSEERSAEIREYVKGGYPWSTITLAQKESDAYKDLQMPGWLPTSLIANILGADSIRRLKPLEDDAVITINDLGDNLVELVLPQKIWTDSWMPIVSPIEIIDGQHRLRAFDYVSDLDGEYELPVIAFHNLDFTWQAYLFYTINIKPKRINTSLAYDLMPLLRIQDWLEHDLNGPDVYKKVRAQELTEILWRNESSPWHNRINMLGDVGQASGGPVSQNAFINSLTNSFVKKWDGKIGGLFGGEMHMGEQDVIQWDKEMQGAYLIFIWEAINSAIKKSQAEWVVDLTEKSVGETIYPDLAPAFTSLKSFFTTDQGIRPVLLIFNDLSFEANDLLELTKFDVDIDYDKYSTQQIIEVIVTHFDDNSVIKEFIEGIAMEIVNKFDWRTPSAFNPNDRDEDLKRQFQNQFRGSGGYREMRIQLLRILANSDRVFAGTNKISDVARAVQTKLGI